MYCIYVFPSREVCGLLTRLWILPSPSSSSTQQLTSPSCICTNITAVQFPSSSLSSRTVVSPLTTSVIKSAASMRQSRRFLPLLSFSHSPLSSLQKLLHFLHCPSPSSSPSCSSSCPIPLHERWRLQLIFIRLRGGPIGGFWVAKARNASAIRWGWVEIIFFHPTVSMTSVACLQEERRTLVKLFVNQSQFAVR